MADTSEILKLIHDANIEVDVTRLEDDAPLTEQGVDSLDMTTLMFEIEQRYGVVITPEQSTGLRSLNDFAKLLRSAGGPSTGATGSAESGG